MDEIIEERIEQIKKDKLYIFQDDNIDTEEFDTICFKLEQIINIYESISRDH